MLERLPESKAQRQRRRGGVTASVAVHVAIIGAVTATTAHVPRTAHREPPVIVKLPPIVEQRVTSPAGPAPRPVCVCVPVPHLIFSAVPTTIPPIDLSQAATPDPGISGMDFGPVGPVNFRAGGILASGDTAAGGVWTTSETLMRVISLARPRYPEVLRAAGVSGRVLVQFVVDTTGRVESNSAKPLQSTHELFTRAVLDVLPSLRFKPTEVNGRKVRALAEMPFEFMLK